MKQIVVFFFNFNFVYASDDESLTQCRTLYEQLIVACSPLHFHETSHIMEKKRRAQITPVLIFTFRIFQSF